MQINVSQQLKSNIGTIRDYEIDTIVDIEGREADIRGSIRLVRTDRGILARGKFSYEIELECSRCLTDFNYLLILEIEEEYFPTLDINTGVSLPSPEEPGSFTIDSHNILDLSEAVRQYTLLAVPIKLLCRQDCAGLCPSCGTNLNERECNCPKQPVDIRWAKLRSLVTNNIEINTDN